MRYKRIVYNVDVMRQSACLAIHPITVNNFAILCNCTPVGRGSILVPHGSSFIYYLYSCPLCFLSCFIIKIRKYVKKDECF